MMSFVPRGRENWDPFRAKPHLKSVTGSGYQTKNCSPRELSPRYPCFSLGVVRPHKDLFDRLVVWQAINRDAVLITKDRELKPYKKLGLRTLWR
jgi:PIN domain nuclease of toxin-antitoxin system